MNQQSWFLVQTKPNKEKFAQEQLRLQEFETFLPLMMREKITRGRRTMSEEILFPRYLFIRLDMSGVKSISPVSSTRGVSHLVRFGMQLAQVDDEIISWLRDRTTQDVSEPFYQAGDRVRFLSGPFKDYEAIFDAYHGLDRAAIFLDLLCKTTRTIVDLAQIQKVSS